MFFDRHDDQASPRTLYATAAPSAKTTSMSKSFFTMMPFRQRVTSGTLTAPTE